MLYEELHGELTALAREGRFDAIAHGCNCFHTMRAGVALAIARAFPGAEAADRATPWGDRAKLGTYSRADVALPNGSRLAVLNAYTQHRYGAGGPHLDHDALRQVLRRINRDFAGQRLGLPKIGALRGGGHWPTIETIFQEELTDLKLTVVHYRPNL